MLLLETGTRESNGQMKKNIQLANDDIIICVFTLLATVPNAGGAHFFEFWREPWRAFRHEPGGDLCAVLVAIGVLAGWAPADEELMIMISSIRSRRTNEQAGSRAEVSSHKDSVCHNITVFSMHAAVDSSTEIKVLSCSLPTFLLYS